MHAGGLGATSVHELVRKAVNVISSTMRRDLQSSTAMKLSITGLICLNTVLVIMLVSQWAFSGQQQPVLHNERLLKGCPTDDGGSEGGLRGSEWGMRGAGSILDMKLAESTNATLSTDGVKDVTTVVIANGVKVSHAMIHVL